MCFLTEGADGAMILPQSVFPDFGEFKQKDDTTVNGVAVQNWEYVFEQDNRTNTYHFYVEWVGVRRRLVGWRTVANLAWRAVWRAAR